MIVIQASTEAAASEDDLLKEALLMAQVDKHKHLVSVVGVVTRGRPKVLVRLNLQRLSHGALSNHTRSYHPSYTAPATWRSQ